MKSATTHKIKEKDNRIFLILIRMRNRYTHIWRKIGFIIQP